MDDLTITHEQNESSGRYVIQLASDAIAEMTYQRTGPSIISIDHTRVPPQFRGQKIADKLMQRAIEDARKSSAKIVPVCSYVAVQFKRHPEWAHLLAG